MLAAKDGDNSEPHMRYVVTAVAVAAALAAPAFAKKQTTVSPEAAAAQASVPAGQSYQPIDHYTVIVNGTVAGRDPDPNVRLMLLRDPKIDAN